jgi:hypothetical protein
MGSLITPQNSNKTYVYVRVDLLDGEYREQIEYVKFWSELKNFTITDKGIRVELKGVTVQKTFLRLFTRMDDML